MLPSGNQWVSRFPTSKSINDLAEPFLDSARRFLAALLAAQADVIVEATLRPPERAYLMHYSFLIARQGLDPGTVPAMPGVDIQWVHADLALSRAAAEQMVAAYGIVFAPALTSRHTQGLAIDMNITWQNDLKIDGGDGTQATISSLPRDGAGNADLHRVGASYGVMKLLSDPPHWSSDGR